MSQNEENLQENDSPELDNLPESNTETSQNEEAQPSALEGKVVQLEQEIVEHKDKYLRLFSEFENFRRRTAKEKGELILTANEHLIVSLLPVLDDFDRALKALDARKDEKELEGVFLIYNKFQKTIEKAGAKPMDIPVGADFNADFHEAITQVPTPDEALKGKVMDVIEKGYLLNEKVIRFAKVVVGG